MAAEAVACDRIESVPFVVIPISDVSFRFHGLSGLGRGLIDKIAAQELFIEEVAERFAQTTPGRGICLARGTAGSWLRKCGPVMALFPAFIPQELSLTNHHQVVGANGQRQAMFLENVPGLAGNAS